MATVDDLDQAIEKWRLATAEFISGNPRPAQELFSHRADVTLANPLGPAAPEIGPVAEDTSPSAVPVALRVTMTFRQEGGTWKVVHRHADSVTTAQPAESVVQR